MCPMQPTKTHLFYPNTDQNSIALSCGQQLFQTLTPSTQTCEMSPFIFLNASKCHQMIIPTEPSPIDGVPFFLNIHQDIPDFTSLGFDATVSDALFITRLIKSKKFNTLYDQLKKNDHKNPKYQLVSITQVPMPIKKRNHSTWPLSSKPSFLSHHNCHLSLPIFPPILQKNLNFSDFYVSKSKKKSKFNRKKIFIKAPVPSENYQPIIKIPHENIPIKSSAVKKIKSAHTPYSIENKEKKFQNNIHPSPNQLDKFCISENQCGFFSQPCLSTHENFSIFLQQLCTCALALSVGIFFLKHPRLLKPCLL